MVQSAKIAPDTVISKTGIHVLLKVQVNKTHPLLNLAWLDDDDMCIFSAKLKEVCDWPSLDSWKPIPVPEEEAFDLIKAGIDTLPEGVKMFINSGQS